MRNVECTTVVSHAGASIAVCGGVDNNESVLFCTDVAGFADQIQQTCLVTDGLANGRTGGTFTVSASKRVIVF